MEYDVIIIGAGPAGYVAAIRAGQVGLKTALIEKKHIGGMCLNWGCIPTKAIIESAKFYKKMKDAKHFGIDGIKEDKLSFNWTQAKARSRGIIKRLGSGVEYLLKKNAVEVIIGEAVINSNTSVTVNNRLLETKNIIIATGSYPTPFEANIGDKYMEVEKLFELEQLPDNVVLSGYGPTVAELAQFFRFLGKEVTIILNEDFIIRDADPFLSDYLLKKLKSERIKVIHASKADGYKDGYLLVDENKIKCDMLINCNYRHAIIPKAEVEIKTGTNGFIETDDNLETNQKGIYAIGDVNGKSYLAHAASAQGIWVINHLKGIMNVLNLKLYPLNVYTSPEIAQVGMSETELQMQGIEYKISQFPLSANAKALIEGNSEGMIRILSGNKYGEVYGIQIIAENATDMIAEATVYLQVEGTVYDIAQTIHAHPTVSEIFLEAGFDAIDQAIHI